MQRQLHTTIGITSQFLYAWGHPPAKSGWLPFRSDLKYIDIEKVQILFCNEHHRTLEKPFLAISRWLRFSLLPNSPPHPKISSQDMNNTQNLSKFLNNAQNLSKFLNNARNLYKFLNNARNLYKFFITLEIFKLYNWMQSIFYLKYQHDPNTDLLTPKFKRIISWPHLRISQSPVFWWLVGR